MVEVFVCCWCTWPAVGIQVRPMSVWPWNRELNWRIFRLLISIVCRQRNKWVVSRINWWKWKTRNAGAKVRFPDKLLSAPCSSPQNNSFDPRNFDFAPPIFFNYRLNFCHAFVFVVQLISWAKTKKVFTKHLHNLRLDRKREKSTSDVDVKPAPSPSNSTGPKKIL